MRQDLVRRRTFRGLCEIDLLEGTGGPKILFGIATKLASAQEVWPDEVGEAWRAGHG